MPSPFPGMDPYLESPTHWSDFHATFIQSWREAIGDRLPDNYFARVGEEVVLTEAFIETLRLPNQEVVAVLELLSPTNKSGDGRGFYMEKRQQLLRQKIHIVELDLIRAGKRLQLDKPLPRGDYYAFISRSDRRPYCDVYPWTVRDSLPLLPIPLLAPDPDVEIDLGDAFRVAYQRGRYERLIRYEQAVPAPSFAGADAEWVAGVASSARV